MAALHSSRRTSVLSSTMRLALRLCQAPLRSWEIAMDNEFDLDRFVNAQDPVYSDVLAELRTGRKRTHWMWFVFPQIAGLGQSEMARKYAIASGDEAAAYLAHPVLG